MNYYISNELYHHGILGQKWGIRRYQNKDGSLTPEGRAKYGKEISDRFDQHRKTVTTSEKLAKNITDTIHRDSKADFDYDADYKHIKEFLKNYSDWFVDDLLEEGNQVVVDDYAFIYDPKTKEIKKAYMV